MTVSAEIEALRQEMAVASSRIEGKLDAFIASHAAQHTAEQQVFHKHEIDMAGPNSEWQGPPKMPDRVRAIEDYILADKTAREQNQRWTRAIFGTSAISLALGVIEAAHFIGWF